MLLSVRTRAAELAERGVELLVQDEQGRSQILHRFRSEPGTVSVRIEVRTGKVSTRPGKHFHISSSRSRPILTQTIRLSLRGNARLQSAGGDPFLDYVLPMTAMQFTQGFGRLMRSETDIGAAMVCDRRLHSPTQAQRVILGSLPDPTIHEALDRDDAWTRAIEFVTGSPPDFSTAITFGRDDVTQLLESLRLVAGEDPTAKLIEAAEKLFGITELHPKQLEVMRAFVEGRDFLAVLPTGFGKSLCFQLPALLAPEARATVVVSPLVALIKDQVNDLRGRRGIRPVQGITGTTSRVVQTEILRDTAEGRVRLLYVSPERLARDPVLRGALAASSSTVSSSTKHTVSRCGVMIFDPSSARCPHRSPPSTPDRRGLASQPPRPLRSRPISGALANARTDDRAGAERPTEPAVPRNRVRQRKRARPRAAAVCDLGGKPARHRVRHPAGAGRRDRALLRRAGHAARPYHAGMVPEQRDAVQEDFDSDTTRIIVATKAFGMGINKPNIGWVVHYDLPDSLDGYAQEAGRAARQTRHNRRMPAAVHQARSRPTEST